MWKNAEYMAVLGHNTNKVFTICSLVKQNMAPTAQSRKVVFDYSLRASKIFN